MKSTAAVEAGTVIKPEVIHFFDEPTNTFSYIVKDPDSPACAIIDSVMDFDYPSGSTGFESADAMIAHIEKNGWQLEWILETHVHADHLSAALHIQQKLGGKLGIGRNITVVQDTFARIFNSEASFKRDGSQFDVLFDDGDEFQIGGLTATAIHTPGHTPACMTFVIGDAAFVGDTLFMPDGGTARADFPGGNARTLYQSIQRVLSLPAETRLFMCHDYAPNEREYQWLTTVADERKANIHVHEGISEDEFVAMREARDATLDMPRLILPSLQINMRAGELPPAEDNGTHYLKLPLNLFC